MTPEEQAYNELDTAENELHSLKKSNKCTPTKLLDARAKVAEKYTIWLRFGVQKDDNNTATRRETPIIKGS